MPFNAPSTIPQISYMSFSAPNMYATQSAVLPTYHHQKVQYAQAPCLPTRAPPPSLRDQQTNRKMNDEFVSMKSRIHTILQSGRLSNKPVGFPFHSAPTGHHNAGYAISYASYEFPEYIYLDSKSQPLCAIISYTAPSSTSRMMVWRILAPSRDSMHPREAPTQHVIAQVEVEPSMMETPYGIEFMTKPRILLQALRTSLEHSLHLTIRLADSRTPDMYPSKKGLRYRPGDLIFVSMSNCGRSEVVAVYSP